MSSEFRSGVPVIADRVVDPIRRRPEILYGIRTARGCDSRSLEPPSTLRLAPWPHMPQRTLQRSERKPRLRDRSRTSSCHRRCALRRPTAPLDETVPPAPAPARRVGPYVGLPRPTGTDPAYRPHLQDQVQLSTSMIQNRKASLVTREKDVPISDLPCSAAPGPTKPADPCIHTHRMVADTRQQPAAARCAFDVGGCGRSARLVTRATLANRCKLTSVCLLRPPCGHAGHHCLVLCSVLDFLSQGA